MAAVYKRPRVEGGRTGVENAHRRKRIGIKWCAKTVHRNEDRNGRTEYSHEIHSCIPRSKGSSNWPHIAAAEPAAVEVGSGCKPSLRLAASAFRLKYVARLRLPRLSQRFLRQCRPGIWPVGKGPSSFAGKQRCERQAEGGPTSLVSDARKAAALTPSNSAASFRRDF